MTILLEAGACPIPLPTIEIVGPPDSDPVYKAIAELSHYNWLILTSSNGVHHFFDYLKKQGLNHSNLAHLKTICVGPKTALAAKERGLKGGLVAQEYAAEGIIELFSSTDINEQRILLPRALKARETLPETLRAKGATVDVVPVYETIFPTESAYKLENILGSADIDLITITSASAATNLVKHCPSQHLTKLKALTTACIGPISAKVAAEVGLNVTIIANTYTSEGLLDAIRNYRI
ncbi:uroporphyrinogen-III synthase [bacterium]|nr:uroporphyrinogen-III synthase [bacterium]